MATTIKLKNSVTTTNAPSSLGQGEVAINITDKKVWVGNAATTPIQLLGAGSSASFGALTCTSLTNSGLTSGRVTYASTGGLLADSANFTFNGTTVTMANDASISGLTVGKGGGAVATNTAVGSGALNANTTGASCTAVGADSLALNTTGRNTAYGRYSLSLNTTGTLNTGLGDNSLYSNTTGGNNVAVGYQALVFNTTASNNTAVGYQAAYSNQTGTSTTAVGYKALYAATGNNNTAVGKDCGVSTTTGLSNSFFGAFAGYANTTGANNVAIGLEALQANTTASANTALGYQAGYTNTTASYNTFIGQQAGYSFNTSGNTFNTFVGMQSGYFVTTGTKNTFLGSGGLGYGAGYSMTTGSANTIIGAYTGNQGGLDIRTASNYIVLSDGDGNPRMYFNGALGFIKTAGANDGCLTIDNTSNANGNIAYISRLGSNCNNTTSYHYIAATGGTDKFYVYGNGTYATVSDQRLKKNIESAKDGYLDDVAKLRVVKYNWSDDAENTPKELGWIAQEVEQVFPRLVQDCLPNENGDVYKTVKSSVLPYILLKAIQELKAEVDNLKAQLNNGV